MNAHCGQAVVGSRPLGAAAFFVFLNESRVNKSEDQKRSNEKIKLNYPRKMAENALFWSVFLLNRFWHLRSPGI